MSETVVLAKPPQRTDLACKNCVKFDARPHAIGDHAEHPWPGCREKLKDGTKCPCDWVPSPEGTSPPPPKPMLGDFV